MAPSICHLPNGQTLTVTPVFGGVAFKSNDLSNQRTPFPPGWTVVLNEEDSKEVDEAGWEVEPQTKKQYIHRYTRPTLQNDHLFISAISNPSSTDFRPASSPTRQMAMMLWASLYWYFHQPEPDPRINNAASVQTPEAGRPRGDWRINIRHEGIFKRKHLLAKLERMGLIATEDSSVGTSLDDKSDISARKMFVTRRSFWQIDARIFLFTLSPTHQSPFPSSSPFTSRPSSPKRSTAGTDSPSIELAEEQARIAANSLLQGATPGQFYSKSHLPTYYPPHPPLYVYTNDIRHPLRPKPYRQGETFYTRYIPSLGQYLSFRIASLASIPPSQHGPWSTSNHTAAIASGSGFRSPPRESVSDSAVPTMASVATGSTDVELLYKWMNDERVAHSWGEQGPMDKQEEFLRRGLSSQHSFPVIGSFDGKPFGYFEIYWVKEDKLGSYLGRSVGDWDRGIHLLVGEEQFRGPHRVKVWLSALVHYCWMADMRTDCVMLEPRVDNEKLANYCYAEGFFKEREVRFPHKQSNLLKIYRDTWEKPAL